MEPVLLGEMTDSIAKAGGIQEEPGTFCGVGKQANTQRTMPKGHPLQAGSTDQIRNNSSMKIVMIMDYNPLNKTGDHKSLQTKVEKPGRHYFNQASRTSQNHEPAERMQ